jgi:hypothetical protein
MVLKEVASATMRSPKGKWPVTHSGPVETIPVRLTLDEVSTLVDLASYYGRLLGSVRRVIQVVSPGEMRVKARFVHEESYWLRRFAAANRDRMQAAGESESSVDFTPRSLVAFYGRVLGTLNVPRSRRRLSPAQIEQREALLEKLRAAVVLLRRRDQTLVEEELQTRRPRERAWIEEAVSPSASPRDFD